MGFKLEIDSAAALNVGAGGSIDTGVEKVRVVGAWLGATKNGNQTVDLEIENKDKDKATIYGICIDKNWKSGAINYDYDKWQEFIQVVGLKSGDTASVERTLFDGSKEMQESVKGLVNKVCTMAIQVKLDVNQEGTKEKRVRCLYRTFDKDGLSIAEKTAGSPAKVSVKLATSLTDYETKAFKAFKANGPVADSNEYDSAGSESTVEDEEELL